MGRVDTGLDLSEPAAVQGRYKSCIEEHPGVPNQNVKSRLGGYQNLTPGKYGYSILLRRPSGKLGGTANITFRPFIRRKVFLFVI